MSLLLDPEARQDADVLKTISIYRDALTEIAPDATGKALTCLLLDKPPAGGERRKHGFHLHFPFLSLKNVDQSRVLTPMVRDRVARAGLFFKCEYDVDDIAMKPWLVYGSAKSRDTEPYMVTRVFDCRGKKIKLTTVTGSKYPHTRTLPKLLSLHTETDTEYKVSPKFLIPPKPKRPRPDPLVDTRDTYDTILGLLERLNPERCSRYSDWIGVGKSIYGATGGDGFGLWDDWSHGAHNYRSDVMRQKWRSFSCTEASIGTLRWMARQDDSPETGTDACCEARSSRTKMGTTSSRHISGTPKPNKDCLKRRVFTAGFDVMGTEANVQVGFKSHTLKKYTPPVDNRNDNLRRVPGGPSGTIVPGVGTPGREDIANETTGSAEAQR
jgi:hypothetical protein